MPKKVEPKRGKSIKALDPLILSSERVGEGGLRGLICVERSFGNPEPQSPIHKKAPAHRGYNGGGMRPKIWSAP